jgi:hypothetical protein
VPQRDMRHLPGFLAGVLSAVAFTISPFGVAASQRDCASQVVNLKNFDGTVQRLRQLYREEKFDALDENLSCLLDTKARFQSGKPGAAAVYWMFRRQMPGPGTAPDERTRVLKWKAKRPKSIFPRFAELRLQYALAWDARGSGAAASVSDTGWTSFSEGLRATEQALRRADEDLRDTPIWQNLLFATLLDASQRRTDAEAVFNEGVRRWPDYFDFHEVALSRLVPRWGGSWEAVDDFIIHWSEQRKAAEGDSLYARLYASVIASGANPDATRMDWTRMKASLEDLIQRYPAAENKNLAASFACGFQDAEYVKRAMKRIPKAEIARAHWLRGTDPEACRVWLSSLK